jgi:hypothetical protein
MMVGFAGMTVVNIMQARAILNKEK